MSLRVLWYHNRMNVGGVMNSIWLAERLVRRGHQVTFLAEEGPLCSELVHRGIGFRSIESKRYRHPSLASAWQVVKAINEEKADVTWAMHTPCVLELYLAAFLTGIPVFPLYGTPDIPEYRLPNWGYIGVVLPRLKAYFVRLGAPPDKVQVIHGRLNGDEFRPMVERPRFLRDNFDIPEQNLIVVLVTRVFQSKWGSIQLFVNAARLLSQKRSDVTCVVVGGGDQFENLRQLAQEANVGHTTPAVVLTGMIVGQIPEIMNEADIVVGMGSTCALAMLCGRPVVAVGNNGYSEVIDPDTLDRIIHWHFNLHFESGYPQPERLVTQIEGLLRDEPYRQKLSTFGRELGVRHFDLSAGVDQLERAFLQVTDAGYMKWDKRIVMGTFLLWAWVSRSKYRAQRWINRHRGGGR